MEGEEASDYVCREENGNEKENDESHHEDGAWVWIKLSKIKQRVRERIRGRTECGNGRCGDYESSRESEEQAWAQDE